MHQIRFRLGLRPRVQTPLGELTALPQTPWLDLRGATSKGREVKGGREKEGMEGGGRGKEMDGPFLIREENVEFHHLLRNNLTTVYKRTTDICTN